MESSEERSSPGNAWQISTTVSNKQIKLNIGCGRDYRPGWKNIDISKAVKAEYYLDIRKDTLPFEAGSVSEIYISGVLEQILENEDLIYAVNECHRVLKPGGIMTVIVPNAKYSIAHQDPMDIRKFTPETFGYFIKSDRKYELYGSVYGFLGWSGFAYQENERHIMIITMKR